jgi:hypothetical protein
MFLFLITSNVKVEQDSDSSLFQRPIPELRNGIHIEIKKLVVIAELYTLSNNY